MVEKFGPVYETLRDLAPAMTPESTVRVLTRLEVDYELRRHPEVLSDTELRKYGSFDRREAEFLLGREETDVEQEHPISFWTDVQRDLLTNVRAGLPEGQTIGIAELRVERGSIIVTVVFYYISGKIAAKGVDLMIEGMSEYIGRTTGNYLENAIKVNLPDGYRRMKDISAKVRRLSGYLSKIIEVDSPLITPSANKPFYKFILGGLYLILALLIGGVLFDALDLPLYEYVIDSLRKRVPVLDGSAF